MLNLHFVRLALQNAHFKKSKQTEDDQKYKKKLPKYKKLSYHNETKQTNMKLDPLNNNESA